MQNRGKRFNKIDLPSHLLCITCDSTAFGGVSKRFQWVLGSLFSSSYIIPQNEKGIDRPTQTPLCGFTLATHEPLKFCSDEYIFELFTSFV